MDFNNSQRSKIVEKADIVNIISQYVKLEKKGNNYIGLCPFHDDKNPSMSVSPQKKVFKCFSCGVGGDVITFVSRIKNISINDAMKEVGATVGITVTLSQKDIEFQKNSKYYTILKEASQLFTFYLHNTDEGKEGLTYLYNRKLNDEIINRFNIGLTSDNEMLYKTLVNKNVLPLDMIEVGLVRGDSQYHDVFKNRIMFPLKDLDGNIVGFSGRKYKPDDPSDSKYVNTRETIVFKKGDILYNYSDAIQEIKTRNFVYLYEGFMDVIASVRANVVNAVASMGTSLTQNQIAALKRLTNNVIVCYDSDGPGTIATIKAIELLLSNNMNVSVVRIPNGKDPDEYIFQKGAEELYNVLTHNIISAIDFVMDYEKKSFSLNNINDIEIYKNRIFDYLHLIKSNVIIENTLKRLASELKLNVESLYNDFKNLRYKVSEKPVIQTDVKKSIKIKEKYLKSERKLLKAAFLNQKQCLEIESSLNHTFCTKEHRNILYSLMTYYKTHDIMDKTVYFNNSQLTNEEITILETIIVNEQTPTNEEIIKLIANIKEYPFAKAIDEMSIKTIKNEEDLKNVSNYKRKTTIIKK